MILRTILRNCAVAAAVVFASHVAAVCQTAPKPPAPKPAPAVRMHDNPTFQFLSKMHARQAEARRTGGIRPQAQARSSRAAAAPGFAGFVQAPWTASRQDSDTANTISSVSADFNGDGKADLATIQNDGTLNVMLSSPSGSFVTSGQRASVPLGSYVDGTSWLLTADMNHDGKPDLVAMAVYYGGGIGFVAHKKNRRGTPADSITDPGTYLLTYLNDGTGKFSAPIITSLQTTNYSDSSVWNFALGDINGDGTADAVVVSNELVFTYNPDGSVTTQDITIEQSFLNDGTGNLTPLPEYDYTYNDWLQPAIFQEQLVDMNHDGKLDLVTVLAPDGSSVYTTIQVQVGNNDGTFAPLPADAITNAKTVVNAYNGGNNLVVADVNHDGYPDAVLASNTGSAPGQIYVALNNGDGALGAANSVVGGIDYPYMSGINVADLNADGNPDLIVYTSGQAAIYRGNGDGTFSTSPASQYLTGYTFGMRPAPADFDGDGKLDIADADATQNKAALFQGRGDLTFVGAPAIVPPSENGINAQVVAAGDFRASSHTSLLLQDWTHMNADSYPDLYSASPDGSGGLTYTKALSADVLDAAGTQYVEPITADLNNDGAQDLVIASNGGLSISYSNRDGTFATPVAVNLGQQLGCSISFIDSADLNGDGFADLVIAYPGDAYCYSGGAVPSGYFVLLNNQDGTFTTAFTAFGTNLYQPKLMDANGDGILDLVLADNDATDLRFNVTLIPGKGAGVFDPASATTVLSNYSVSALIAGDFNGDGKQDLTIATAGEVDGSGNIIPGYSGVALLQGAGNGTFSQPQFIDVGHLATWGVYSDLNGDGLPDLALASVDSTTGEPVPSMEAYINAGGGSFTQAPDTYLASFSMIYSTEAYTSYVFAGDFNVDGAPDIVNTASFGSGMLINSGGVGIALTYSPSQVVAGQSVTFSAALTSTVSPAVPTGTVTFTSDGASLGTGTISNGVATFTTSALTAGNHVIQAVYAGDTAHNAASTAISVNVLAVAPSFTLTSTGPASISIAEGSSASVSFALQANQTFSGTVTVACSGAPAGVTCTAQPASVDLSGGGAQSVSVNIQAASNVQTALSLKKLGTVGISFAVVLMLPFRRRPRVLAALMITALLGVSGITGCGGSRNNTVSTSTLTITATSGSIVKTQTIALTVTRK